jgi:glycine cleavage system H protein
MGNYPGNLKYTKDHEWARAEGARYVIGITDHAQAELGEVVFVDLPEVGRQVTAGKPFGAAESTKAASDLFAPLNGKVTRVNEALKGDPSPLNSDPYGAGWLIELEPTDGDTSHLMDADSYVKLLG